MQKCGNCGTKFDVDEARAEFDLEADWAGELTYDDEFPEHSVCDSCAIDITVANLGAGRATEFSVETGLPPEDVRGDWSPSD